MSRIILTVASDILWIDVNTLAALILIQEYNLPWDDRELGKIAVATLLGEPVEVIAGAIRANLVR